MKPMEFAMKRRIDPAWQGCAPWIVEIDGSPTITLLVEVPIESLLPGLKTLAENSENLRITRISSVKAIPPQFIPLESFLEELQKLQSEQTADLSVNFEISRDAFDLDLHMVIHPVKEGKAALELAWWSDQVFSAEADSLAQFQALASYFIELQGVFGAGGLFISPESGLASEESWVEL